MSAALRGPHASTADAVMGAVRGTLDAQKLVFDLRQGCVPANALHDAVRAVGATGDAERMRAFCRHLQKQLEGPSAHGLCARGEMVAETNELEIGA